jgi:hypothetical protein
MREEQELAQYVGELLMEPLADLLRGRTFRASSAGVLEVGLGQLADLLLQLQQATVGR